MDTPNTEPKEADPKKVKEPERPRKIVVIGQSGSGKSALLAGVHFTGNRRNCQVPGFTVEIPSVNDAFSDLSQQFDRIYGDGVIGVGASDRVTDYQMQMVIRRQLLGLPGIRQIAQMIKKLPEALRVECEIQMPDGPGEAMLPTAKETEDNLKYRNLMIEHLREATGIILCVPPPVEGQSIDERVARDKGVTLFFEFFRKLLRQITDKKLAVPWRYLAIVLTKGDEVFYRHGRTALGRLVEESKRETLMSRLEQLLIDESLLNEMKVMTRGKLRIAAGWTSIYGFLPDGSSNYHPNAVQAAEAGLRVRFLAGDGKTSHYPLSVVRKNWNPYQLLDPFLWATGGFLGEGDGIRRGGFVEITPR